MSSSRERSQTKKPNGSIPRGGRLLSLIFALSRNPNRLLPRTHKKERWGSSLNSLTLTRGGTSQLFATANPWAVRVIKGPSSPRRVFDRTGISDEGRSERARAANEFQIGNKVKLRPRPTGHKFRGAASGASRKNRTWETRRLARSIRDVAFASRREFVDEARPRCGSGDRLTWTQPFARQAQVVGQTTRRICSLEIAAEEMTSESGPRWRSEPATRNRCPT